MRYQYITYELSISSQKKTLNSDMLCNSFNSVNNDSAAFIAL